MTLHHSIIRLLTCPICRASVQSDAEGKTCCCSGTRTHCFDFSRSGYLNLGGPRTKEGDGKDAVRARRIFLDAGYYRPLSDEINRILGTIPSTAVLDAGCGEGYYTNRMAVDRDVLGIDLSTAGIDLAAKRSKQLQTRAGFAVASVFELPVADHSFDVVTNIFAPCAETEYTRALAPEGHLLLVGAGELHLMGLKRVLYNDPYTNPGRADLPQTMQLVERKRLRYEITVAGREAIDALFSMTPYYWRTSPGDRAKLERTDALTTELDFDIFLYRKGL